MKTLLMITFSEHASFQDGIFSMYQQLKDKYNVWTLTKKGTDYPGLHEEHNLYVNAPSNPGIAKDTFNHSLMKWIKEKIGKINPDVVYFESFHTWNYPIIFYCKRKHILVSHAIHDVTIHKGDSHRTIKKMLNYSYAFLSDRLIARSEIGYEEAKEMYPRFLKKIHFVDLWYSFPEFHMTVGKDVLFFGRMNLYKGIEYLNQIIEKTPEIHYVVAGKSDVIASDLVSRIRARSNAKVEDRVIPYEDMENYFRDARVIILPYKTATQSGVILDSYKYSKPVLAFNVGALGEEIDNGKTGYVVKAGDVDQMVKKIHDFFEMDNRQYEEMCRNAYNYGYDRYSAQSQVERFIEAVGL
jgi:glycosyltransferase involved in cell wall biosynthesis